MLTIWLEFALITIVDICSIIVPLIVDGIITAFVTFGKASIITIKKQELKY